MFRDDKATIKRPNAIKVQGEITYGEPIIIKENLPCHLSVKSLSAINQTQSTATVLYDFVLFYTYQAGVTVEPNDIIEVITKQGEQYRLRAGESKKRNLTVQVHCEDMEIA